MSASKLQDIKQCYITGQWYGDNGEPLERHHVLNGALRDFAEREGLWIWITPQQHRILHDTKQGVYMLKLLKKIAQLTYEKEHTHDEWMSNVMKSYV